MRCLIGGGGVCDHQDRIDHETGEIFECGCGDRPRAERAPTGQAEGRPLGNTTKFGDASRKPARSLTKYKMLDAARRTLVGTAVRTVDCMKSVAHGTGHATISRTDHGYRVGNVQVCGSASACPICARKIAAQRRDEVQTAVDAWRAAGGSLALLTLTISHSRDDDLPGLLKVLSAARGKFYKSRAWVRFRRRASQGQITSLEVTLGNFAGWHPHNHVLLFLKAGEAVDLDEIDALEAEWLHSVAAAGGHAETPHAFDLRLFDQGDDAAASAYLTKAAEGWDAADEIAGATLGKHGRAGSATPFQVLAKVADGDQIAGRRFRHYATAMKGAKMVRWSPKLKEFFGIGEVSDQDAAEAEAEGEDEGEALAEIVAVIPAKAWRAVVAKYQMVPLLAALADRGLPGIVGIVNAASGQRYRWSDFKPPDTS